MNYFFVFYMVFCLQFHSNQSKRHKQLDLFSEMRNIPLNQLVGGNPFHEDRKLRLIRSAEELEISLDKNISEKRQDSGSNAKNFIQDSEDSVLFRAICEQNSDANNNATNSSSADDKKRSEPHLACTLLKKLIKNSNPIPPAKKSMSTLEKYLPEDYNKYEVPRIKPTRHPNGTLYIMNDSPAECLVYLSIRSIRDIDEEKGIVTLDMDIILIWSDGNIFRKYEALNDVEKANFSSKPVILNPRFLEKIWVPDIYFEEISSITLPTFLGNSVTVVLHPTIGLLIYRSRALVNLSCEIDFTYYPADTQECIFHLKSFSHISKLLKLDWYGTGIYLHETSDPNFDYQISSTSKFEMPLPLGPGATDVNAQYTNLQFVLKARRKMTYHLVQTYFASIFFVIVTWLCFMIPPDIFEVRIGIALSTLLTLTAMFSSIREQNPVVSYVKAVDIWMATSVFFIFFALAGFITTAWIKRGLKRLQKSSEEEEINLGMLDRKVAQELSEDEIKRKMHKFRIVYMLIERFAIYILSATYVIFNVIYWSWLLIQSNHLNWNLNSTLNNIEED